ncbi:MAG TPA: wax ester/triacylglycerol synthase family O-acyltransferase [Humibacillus sp.]|nr:wax ester/triacylglycerol synthase family O-acyltransferase [Humibacillus sp.]
MSQPQRLHALDAIFLPMETSIQSLHVGSVLILEGRAPEPTVFREHVVAAVSRVPMLGRRAVRMPLDLGRPIWVDAPDVDLGDHVRHVTLRDPGDDGQLRALVSEVMNRRLDPGRPLWELCQVDGLSGGRWAVIAKAHHTMVDGQSGSDLVAALLSDASSATDATSATSATGADSTALLAPRAEPHPAPSLGALIGDLLAWLVLLPVRTIRLLTRSALHPQAARRRVRRLRFGLRQVLVPDLPPSVLTGPLGSQRIWGWTAADLAPVVRAARDAGATVNDVFLAALAGGCRRYLLDRGEPIDSIIVRAIVPVSTRTPEQPLRPGNLASAMFVVLPVDQAEPSARLATVAARTAEQKARGVPAATAAVVRMADHLPAVLLARGARAYGRSGQGRVNLVASNVRGPTTEQHLLGSRLIELVPWVPTAQEIRLSTAMVTCAGRMTIGITGDAAALPDVDRLISAVEHELTDLVAADHRS